MSAMTLSPQTTESLAERCETTAALLKNLAHPLRLQLLCYLAAGEKSVGDLEALSSASQSLVSQYLARMRRENLVQCRKDGKFVWYSVADPKVLQLIRALHRIFCP
jgi:ArsR family transcriptional regulator